ncbi:MAG: 50S ribosomal protein L22 [Gemmatimonadetes bacterium]|nr:50S ribosomal protein L22 [Gemmatimonadota bacterium]MXX34746.1 50S ribosomal protein L22 [Gemmatimonadota bacterium]MYA11415.1 50S ribosomal protein L22 [Gemmatimonadota bacterium]MYD15467.1 50S ribosomal protein L22 [Gemmatimonadota bacterium]MYE69347.1 50S ribosomal protein L22 [Gemmatimonadota bacterium]
MEARAIARHIRMSPRKVRLVVDQIRGRSVNEAISVLTFSKKAAAVPVSKTLLSAIANAQDLADRDGDSVDVDELVVSRAFVDEGPTLKRWRARAMGRASPRRRRTSHITVEVTAKEN